MIFLIALTALSCILASALLAWIPRRLAEERRCAASLTSFWTVLRQPPVASRWTIVVVILHVTVAALCYWRLGSGIRLIAWLIFYWALITLAAVDLRTMLLPDMLTLPLVWLGLVLQLWPDTRTVGPDMAIAGAALGYFPLWVLAHCFRLIRKREGLGFGDIKLMAAIGAWAGPWVLPWVILIASLAAILGAGLLAVFRRIGVMHMEFPFGPWIAISAFTITFAGLHR